MQPPASDASSPPATLSLRSLWPALALVCALLVAAAVAAAIHQFRTQADAARAEVQAVADLRQAQVSGWLREKLGQARFISGSTVFAALYLDWLDRADSAALNRLMTRLVALREANESDAVLLLGPQAEVVARETPVARPVAAELRDAALRAMQQGEVTHTGLYRRDGPEPVLRLDIVIPLLQTGSPARGAIVLRMDPRRFLYPTLTAWPVPSDSGETVLWRRDGDRVQVLSPLRHQADSAARLTLPLSTPTLTIARVLRGDVPPNQTFSATDHRGATVLASARQVEGSDWWLVSKLDQSEVDAPAWQATAWVAGLLAAMLLGLLAAARSFVQRQALRDSETDRARQRERLQALQLLESIAEASADAIFAKDLQGRYLLFNRAACEGAGRSREQVIGFDDNQVFGAEVGAALQANDAQVLATGSQATFEESLPSARGPRTSLSTKGPLRDADGRVIGVFGVGHDVTESRRAEQALRESEAHYRSVVSVLSEGIMVFEPGGRLISGNPAAGQLLGVPAEALSGTWAGAAGWAPINADGTPFATADLPPARVAATGQAQRDTEIQALGPGGQRRWFSLNAQPVTDPQSARLLAVVMSITDITERRALAQEIEQHRNHLQALVEQRTHALEQANAQLAEAVRFVRTVADNLPGRVAYWDRALVCRFANRAYFEWFGKARHEVIGQHASTVAGSAYLQEQQPRLDAALAGQSQHFERETRRPDGTLFHHLVHYVPDLGDDGGVQGVYVMAFDISAQKRAEAELQRINADLTIARDRAESASRSKSAFLANTSHEIRTPMNAIIGLAHLMTRDARDAKQRDRLEKLSNSAHHLLQILNDILDLSKIEAGRLELEDIEFSLDVVLARIFEMVAERARQKGLELIIDTDHLPDRLRGDPTRLSQALLNLLSNAVKFTESGWVRLGGDLLDEQDGRLHVRFSVHDTGVGVAASDMGALFNDFEQVDASTNRRHGGTGLGLALTRRLAAIMGGEAGVESELGKGSHFWFTARLGRGDSSGDNRPLLAGRRVLLVDDLPEARVALADRLQLFGMRVEAVESGQLALDSVERAIQKASLHDVLLIDWRMEPLDGIETLRLLRSRLCDGLPPAVLVTAHDEDAMRREALAASFDAVLVKPITASTLLDTLQRVMRREASPVLAAAPPGAAERALLQAHAGTLVLLAEDNPVNQEVAIELLRAAGLEADLASDGEQAVRMALDKPYAALLMDVQMPGMDGLQATAELRRRGFGAPILAMTANAFGEDREACLAAGMNDHIAKPVEPEQLYGALLRWLPGKRVAPLQDSAAAGAPQAADDPAVLLTRLSALPGFDLGVLLRASGGRPEVVLRLLRRFVEVYADGLPVLVQPGGDERLAAWRRAAHSLQGAAGAVGAVELHEQARALGAAAHAAVSASDVAEAAAQLDAALCAMVAGLKAQVAW